MDIRVPVELSSLVASSIGVAPTPPRDEAMLAPPAAPRPPERWNYGDWPPPRPRLHRGSRVETSSSSLVEEGRFWNKWPEILTKKTTSAWKGIYRLNLMVFIDTNYCLTEWHQKGNIRKACLKTDKPRKRPQKMWHSSNSLFQWIWWNCTQWLRRYRMSSLIGQAGGDECTSVGRVATPVTLQTANASDLFVRPSSIIH